MNEVIIESKQYLNDGGPSGIERAGITWDGKRGKQVAFIAEFIWPGDGEEFRKIKVMLQKWAAAEEMYEALKRAEQFITNGIELGYIRMPDKDCPDPAHETPDIIKAALAKADGK